LFFYHTSGNVIDRQGQMLQEKNETYSGQTVVYIQTEIYP